MDKEERKIRQRYRVVNLPTWRVEVLYRDKWVACYFCSSKKRAMDCLERCIQRALQLSRMTDDERMQQVLRRKKGP